MSTIHKTDRNLAVKKAPKKKVSGERGNLSPAEIKPLIFAARRAFDCQFKAGLVDADFNSWRREQVQSVVGKPGLSKCHHDDFRPILAHFQTLAGEDVSAFRNLISSGAASAAADDTHERRRQIAHGIIEALDAHLHLAESSIDSLVAESSQAWYAANQADLYPGPDPVWLQSVASRKAAIEATGKGPITVGYLVYLVRQKTRRPDLNLTKEWRSELAARCTVRQLTELRITIINRINAVEGLGSTSSRNKSQKSKS